MTIGVTPFGGISQGGPTQSGPIRIPWWKRRHARSHPGATGSDRSPENDSRKQRLAVSVDIRGNLELTDELDLLEPFRAGFEHRRAELLGSLERCSTRTRRSPAELSVSGRPP